MRHETTPARSLTCGILVAGMSLVGTLPAKRSSPESVVADSVREVICLVSIAVAFLVVVGYSEARAEHRPPGEEADAEHAMIETLCRRQSQSTGPASYYSCMKEQTGSLRQVGKRPELTQFSSAEKTAIEQLCKRRLSFSGPAQYYRCLQTEVDALNRSPGPPSMDGLSDWERDTIQRLCDRRRIHSGPADHYACLRQEMIKVERSGGRPDLSETPSDERVGIDRYCQRRLTYSGPSEYYTCLRAESAKLSRAGERPHFTNVPSWARSAIERVCERQAAYGGPVAVYSCQWSQIRALERAPTSPDLGELGGADQNAINRVCDHQLTYSGPAEYLRCLNVQVAALHKELRGADAKKLSGPTAVVEEKSEQTATPQANPPTTLAVVPDRKSPQTSAVPRSAVQPSPSSSSLVRQQPSAQPPRKDEGVPGIVYLVGGAGLLVAARKVYRIARSSRCMKCGARTANKVMLCDACTARLNEEQVAEARRVRVQEEQRAAEERAHAAEEQRRILAERARHRDYLIGLSPSAFEAHVAQLFGALGYSVRLTPASNDAGVDAYIEKDGKKGVVQCKHFTRGVVSRPDLQQFYGVLIHERANEGFFVTTAHFSVGAVGFVSGKPIHLIDLGRLIEMAQGAFTEEFIRSGPSGTTAAAQQGCRRHGGRRWR